MALVAQQTFVDRLSEAEDALNELVSYADRLTSRLVGYSDAAEAGYGDQPPSSGILPDVGDTAGRMARKVRDIRQNLGRIAESLPAEAINKPLSGLGQQTARTGY
jgi:hypothetical protein